MYRMYRISKIRGIFSALNREGFLKITKEEAATIRMIEKVMRTRFISKYVKS